MLKSTASISVHLAMVFLLFFLLVMVLGGFSILTLRHFNGVSADVRDRWMQSIRVIGDLNNFTSDFRAAEGTHLLSPGEDERTASDKEMTALDGSIALARSNYERIPHDAAEMDLYRHFTRCWDDYRGIITQSVVLSRNGRHDEAVAHYRTTSRNAYNAASDTLGLLTDLTVANARAAGRRQEQAYESARGLIGLVLACAALMVIGAVLYIRQRLSNPLMALSASMHALADNNTDIPIDGIDRQDEIGEMARAVVVFRNNAIELAIGQRGLAQQAMMLEEKLAEEQRLMQMQQNFVSMASHEFRTPLTIIDAHAQRLHNRQHHITPDELAERAGKIRSAVLRMVSLITSLLDRVRVTDGDEGLYLHPSTFDLRSLLHEVCLLHREISPKSQIWENFGNEALTVVADQRLLFQVFSNLVANAIKYSPKGGLISIGAHGDGAQLTVIVKDRGIGLQAADIGHLFERFYRGGNVSGIVGTGIGLFFVKTVIDLHGGHISVAGEEGQGACFTVQIPAHPPGVGLPVPGPSGTGLVTGAAFTD